jgi:peroxiredoxin Q/BCP
MVSIGKKVKTFTLPGTGPGKEGQMIRLKDFTGKKVVLYFYPKDSTPGCTTEGMAFRDAKAKFSRANAVILGISRDSLHSHQKFKDKQAFNF